MHWLAVWWPGCPGCGCARCRPPQPVVTPRTIRRLEEWHALWEAGRDPDDPDDWNRAWEQGLVKELYNPYTESILGPGGY